MKEKDPYGPNGYTRAEAEGWDAAIDLIVKKLRDQIEVLHKSARETTRVDHKDNYKFGVTLYRALVEELKKAKGNPGVQRFDQNEVRAIIDHVTGECQSVNTATMSYFDTSFFPRYLAGELELKTFTLKLTPETPKSDK